MARKRFFSVAPLPGLAVRRRSFFMETKEQKQYYITVKGQKVPVSEEVYRAYVRPVRAQQRAMRRNWRCVLKADKYGLVRCKEDCSQCPYAQEGNVPTGNGTSLDLLCEAGFDAPSSVDIETEMIECEERMEQSARVQGAIGQLNERQQYIIREIYFNGRTQAEVSRALGIDKTSISKAVARALASLKKILKKN